MKKNTFKLSALTLSILSASGFTQAQDLMDDEWGLEEIVVTAQKRSEPLQTTPVAVTPISTDEINKFDITDAGDIEQLVPALSITPSATSKSSLLMSMRGVGVDDAQIAVSPAVGTYIDGVYAGQTLGLNAEIVDLENIEVMRGPQGTLYGRNTTGGAINLISSKPSETTGGELTVSGGSDGYNRQRLRVDTGEHGGLSSRIALSQSSTDGWRDNETPDASYDFGEDQKTAARLAFLFKASDNITLEYAYDYSKQKGPQDYYQLIDHDPNAAITIWTATYTPALGATANAFATNLSNAFAEIADDERKDTGSWRQDLDKTETEVQGHNFTANFQVNDYLSIKSITGVRSMEETSHTELQGGQISSPDLVFIGTYNQAFPALVDNAEQEHDQISEEVQFIGANEADTLQYVAGLYFYTEEAFEDAVNFLYSRRVETDNATYAAFGQATYTPDWMLDGKMGFTLGARYTVDDRNFKKDFRAAGTKTVTARVESDESFDNFSPNFMLSYAINDDVFSYAKVMTGYKSGGYNVRAQEPANGEDFTPYDEEKLLGYELGLKSQWFDRKLRANIALYQNDYQDMHVTQIPVATSPWETEIVNAAEATITGFELDMQAQATESLFLSLAYAYTDTEFDKVIDTENTFGKGAGVDISDYWGATLSPEHVATLTAEYKMELEQVGDLSFLLSYNWRDDHQSNPARIYNDDVKKIENLQSLATGGSLIHTDTSSEQENNIIEAYGVLNGRITLSNIDMGDDMSASVSLWGKNLANEDYHAYKITGFTQGTLASFGEPRSAGADFTIQF